VLTAPGPESAREPLEVRLIDSPQHGAHRALDDFVLQRRDAQRAQVAVLLGDKPSRDGQRPVRASLDLSVQLQQIALQVTPRSPATSRRRPLERHGV